MPTSDIKNKKQGKKEKSARIEIRLDPDKKSLLERAAEKHGLSLSSFVLSTSLKEATAIVEEPHTTYLSKRDWNMLMDLIENPPPPNEKLKAAMKEYLAMREESED